MAIEAYPIDGDRKLASWDLFLGTLAAYQDAGFVEVARHVPTRPILRNWRPNDAPPSHATKKCPRQCIWEGIILRPAQEPETLYWMVH